MYVGLLPRTSYAGVITFYYKNLIMLGASSKSAGDFFFSLPVETQARLADWGALIHTAADLHLYADRVDKHARAVRLAESLLL